MAVHGFKGLGWFLCCAVIAPACYMVNSHGAAEQARLNAMKAAIIQAQRDIRGLETEFDTRANLAQLERWNGDVLALAAPAPQQFLASEAALADLDKAGAGSTQVAALVVPVGAPAAAPAVATASVQPVALPQPIRAVQAAKPIQATQAVQAVPRAQPSVTGKSAVQQDRELRGLMAKADKKAVAMSENKLLSASTMDDLKKLAQREKLALR